MLPSRKKGRRKKPSPGILAAGERLSCTMIEGDFYFDLYDVFAYQELRVATCEFQIGSCGEAVPG